MAMELKERDLKKYAQQKIDVLKNEIKKWQLVLNALEEDSEQPDLFPNNQSPPRAIAKKIKPNPTTLRERCEKILFEANEPMTTRELKKQVEQQFGKQYNFYSFSGSFSQTYRSRKSLIKKYDLQNPTNEVKAVYCLNDWFDVTGKLKKEYLDKVEEKYSTT